MDKERPLLDAEIVFTALLDAEIGFTELTVLQPGLVPPPLNKFERCPSTIQFLSLMDILQIFKESPVYTNNRMPPGASVQLNNIEITNAIGSFFFFAHLTNDTQTTGRS